MSQPNGSLEQFKIDHAKRLKRWYAEFNSVMQGFDSPTDEAQAELYEVCKSADQVTALLIYLVERRELDIRLVLEHIKRPNFCIGLALCRQRRLVKA